MTRHEKAAIIGYWRSGASLYEIAGMTGVEIEKVKKIITEYHSKPTNKEHFYFKTKQ